MDVNKQILLAGMQQLSSKYKGNGVDRVTVQMVSGRPVFVMHGPTPTPPSGLPGTLTVPDVNKQAVKIPILWAQIKQSVTNGSIPTVKSNEIDLDRSLWFGFTPIDRRDVVTEFQPAPTDNIVTAGAIPPASHADLQIAVDITGEWGWWTKPFDAQGCLCCTVYAVPSIVFHYVVPPDYALFIDAWAFFVDSALPIGETFNVRFLRDGETLLEYDEVIVDPLNADPAKRCLFSGSIDQVQRSYLRIDRNQTFTVIITPKGLAPFLKGPNDTYCATLCVLLHGHLQALLDNRDGAPRPKDVGKLRDDLWGDGTLRSVTAEDVAQMMAWLDAATANAAPANPTETPSTKSDVGSTSAMSSPVASEVAPAALVDSTPEPAKASPAAATGGVLLAAAAAALLLNGEGSSVSPSPLS